MTAVMARPTDHDARKVQRYDWEDALVQAKVREDIPQEACLTALLLASRINWNPTDPKRGGWPGLYWKNEDAAKSVGISLRTFKRHRKILGDTGFVRTYGGNLIPTIPAGGATAGTGDLDTASDTGGTGGGDTGGTPWSEDQCNEDEWSESPSPEDAPSFFDDDDFTTSIATAPDSVSSSPTGGEVEETAPPKMYEGKEAKWARNAAERVARDEGFDLATGEYGLDPITGEFKSSKSSKSSKSERSMLRRRYT